MKKFFFSSPGTIAMSKSPLVLVFICFLFVIPGANSQNEPKKDDTDQFTEARQESLKRLRGIGLVKPDEVQKEAEELFAMPLSDQAKEALLKLAIRANAAANQVNVLRSAYLADGSESYPYLKFINKMKRYRNQAYFNLGKKASLRGSELEAFTFFSDALRLSEFDASKDDSEFNDLRWKAEMEMQKLMGITLPSKKRGSWLRP